MAIVSTDLLFYHSGGAGNSDPDASLGGIISTTQITDASDNNLFDDVTGDEASSGDTEYRGFYLFNNHATITLQNSVIWFSSNTTSADDTLNMALAGEGVNATMETIANESTAPSGESFSAPASKGAGLSVGDVPAQQRYGIWLERVVDASASAVNGNSATIQWEGDTAAS